MVEVSGVPFLFDIPRDKKGISKMCSCTKTEIPSGEKLIHDMWKIGYFSVGIIVGWAAYKVTVWTLINPQFSLKLFYQAREGR